MAKWVKGQSGNPGGAPKKPDNLNSAMGSAKFEVLQSIVKFGMMPRSRFNEYLKTDEPSMWERVTAGCFVRATAGSLNHIEALWSRIIGPAPKVLQVDGMQLNQVQSATDPEMLTHIMIKLKEAAEKDLNPPEEILHEPKEADKPN